MFASFGNIMVLEVEDKEEVVDDEKVEEAEEEDDDDDDDDEVAEEDDDDDNVEVDLLMVRKVENVGWAFFSWVWLYTAHVLFINS